MLTFLKYYLLLFATDIAVDIVDIKIQFYLFIFYLFFLLLHFKVSNMSHLWKERSFLCRDEA